MCITPIVARQWFCKHTAMEMKTNAATGELLDMSFSMQSVSHQRKAGDWFSLNFFFIIMFSHKL
jgi:hypothetical protein